MILENRGYGFRELITIYGKIKYRRTMLAPADMDSAKSLAKLQKSKYICPLDCILQVDRLPFKITVKMMAVIAKEAARAPSYKKAARVILEHYKVDINTATLRLVTGYVGAIVSEDDRHRAIEAINSSNVPIDHRRRQRRKDNDTLFLKIDDYKVNTRDNDKKTSWTVCKIGLVYHSKDRYEQRDDTGKIRIRILKKRIVSCLGDGNDFKYYLLAAAREYNYEHCSRIVVISNGASWTQEIIEELFPDAVHILDLCQVGKHVRDFGNCIKKDRKKADEWISQVNEMIENSETEEVLKILDPYKDTECPENIKNLYTYIESHKKCMDYRTYRKINIYAGNVDIESTDNYMMRLQSMRWNPDTAQPMLSLKSRLESDCWYEIEPLVQGHIYPMQQPLYILAND